MDILKKVFLNWSLFLVRRKYSDASAYIRTIRKVSKSQLIWYPGHINKGIEQLNKKIGISDAIIEVHDCRIPFTGRTDLIHAFGQVKPRILLMNKADLIPKESKSQIKKIVENLGRTDGTVNVIFTQLNDYGRQPRLFQKVHESLLAQLDNSKGSQSEIRVLVTGLPNVGKSTFINGLRNWSARKYPQNKPRSMKPASVGPHAGVTRTVSERILVSEGPPRLYVLDSPGIWEPSKEDIEAMLKMAACGCLNFDSLCKEIVIDFLLFTLNRRGILDYVTHYGLPSSTDDVIELVQGVCAARGLVTRASKAFFGQRFAPQVTAAFDLIFRDFGSGALGQVVLDDVEEASASPHGLHLLPLGTVLSPRPRSQAPFPFVWGGD